MENVMNREQALPRARSERLVIQELPDETLVYDLDRHKVHCLNPSATYVWRQCDGSTSVATVADGLHATFGLPADERIVSLALDELRKARLLDVDHVGSVTSAKVARRDAVKWVGVAAGLAALVPVVTSLVAPTAALAVTSCANLGQPCSPTLLCCSGLICVNNLCRTIGT